MDGSRSMKRSYDRITVTFEKLNTTRIKNIGKMSKYDFSRGRKMPFSDIIRCILNKKYIIFRQGDNVSS